MSSVSLSALERKNKTKQDCGPYSYCKFYNEQRYSFKRCSNACEQTSITIRLQKDNVNWPESAIYFIFEES